MLYKVAVGNAVLEKCIESVQFNVSTPSDYIFTSRGNNKNLIKITGNIDTEESTVALYEWALLPATNPECYKEITIEHYKEEKLLRKVTFSKAFVVKYSESYSNDEGVGTFTLYIKQLYGQDVEVTGETSSHSSTVESNSVPEMEEERQDQSTETKKEKEKKDHIIKVGRRKALAPNTEYEVNGYKYKTDELGRIISCEGTLKLEKGKRNAYDQKIVGRENREKDTDEGGHLIATIFKGSGDIDNLVPMNANLNKGEWKKLENEWTKALSAKPPKEVKVKIIPIYEGDSQRPVAFKIDQTINNRKLRTKFLKNSPGGI